MEYEQHLQKAIDDMKAAENRLLESGFSVDQWVSIKQYIQASIFRFQLLSGSALWMSALPAVVVLAGMMLVRSARFHRRR